MLVTAMIGVSPASLHLRPRASGPAPRHEGFPQGGSVSPAPDHDISFLLPAFKDFNLPHHVVGMLRTAQSHPLAQLDRPSQLPGEQ